MSEDAAFLAKIRAAPKDNLVRLVYADWLDEQGRPGGDFLRTDCEIADLDPLEYERRAQLRTEASLAGVIDLALPDTSDTYYWQRAHLVAKLWCTTRDLNEEWMAVVSRVPFGEINARNREIQSWLRQQIEVSVLLARMAELDKPTVPPKTLWQRVRGLFGRSPDALPAQTEGPFVRGKREWVEANLRPGDELWEYDTGGETWAHLCGEMGYAIVRNGEVIEYEMLMMN